MSEPKVDLLSAAFAAFGVVTFVGLSFLIICGTMDYFRTTASRLESLERGESRHEKRLEMSDATMDRHIEISRGTTSEIYEYIDNKCKKSK